MKEQIYYKKPVVVEAMQVNKDNIHHLISWANKNNHPLSSSIVLPTHGGINLRLESENKFVPFGDYVVKDVKGCYSVNESSFKTDYDLLDKPFPPKNDWFLNKNI